MAIPTTTIMTLTMIIMKTMMMTIVMKIPIEIRDRNVD